MTPTLTDNKFTVPLDVPAGMWFQGMTSKDVAVLRYRDPFDQRREYRTCPYQPGETVEVVCDECDGAGPRHCKCEKGLVTRTVLRCEPVQQGEGGAWEIEVSDG